MTVTEPYKPPSAEEKKCDSCANLIPKEAKLCSICHSYQGWRRYTGFSTAFFAVITALVSVLTVSLPEFKKYMMGDYSQIDFRFNGIIGNKMVFTVTNLGNRPTTIDQPRFGFVSRDRQSRDRQKSETYDLSLAGSNEIEQLYIEALKSRQIISYLGPNSGENFRHALDTKYNGKEISCAFLFRWVEFGETTQRHKYIDLACPLAVATTFSQ